MLDAALRPPARRLLRRLVPRRVRPAVLGARPEIHTGLGMLAGLAAAGAAARGSWMLALVFWLLSRIMDGLDGLAARASGRADDFGGLLDLSADVLVYAALPLGVAAGVGTLDAWRASAFLLAACYLNITTVTVLGAMLDRRQLEAPADEAGPTLPAGLIEGTETIVGFCILLLAEGHRVGVAWALAALIAVGAGSRVGRAGRDLR